MTQRKLTDVENLEMDRLHAYFPFRIVYAVIEADGKFYCGAVSSMRIPNKIARQGLYVVVRKP